MKKSLILSGVTVTLEDIFIDGPNSIGAGRNGSCAGVIIEDPSKVIQQ